MNLINKDKQILFVLQLSYMASSIIMWEIIQEVYVDLGKRI